MPTIPKQIDANVKGDCDSSRTNNPIFRTGLVNSRQKLLNLDGLISTQAEIRRMPEKWIPWYQPEIYASPESTFLA
jgi:hypothetical protein